MSNEMNLQDIYNNFVFHFSERETQKNVLLLLYY